MVPSNVFQDAVDGLFQAPWWLKIVPTTNLTVILPSFDFPFTVDNCQLAWTQSTPYECRIPQMSSKMQLTSCSRDVDEKICVGSFSRWSFHMRGSIWEWSVVKLEGGGSQLLIICRWCTVGWKNVRRMKIRILADIRVLSRLLFAFIEASVILQLSDK